MVRDTSGNEREVTIARTPFTMGRQSDNDLVLLDSRISRHHAKIFQNQDAYQIADTESRHGTFVNNERIVSCALKSGDHISLGVTDAYQLTFLEDHAALPKLLEQMGKPTTSRAPQLQHLGLLLQMAQMLNRAPALEEILTLLVDSAIQLTDAERGMLFLLDDAGVPRLRLARGRGGMYIQQGLENYSHAAIKRVMESGREDVILEEEVSGRATQETGIVQAGVRGIVAVPLQKHPVMEMTGETMSVTAPEILGVLYLDSRSGATALTGLDRQVLQSFAVEGATVIENARMFRLTREQERLQHEFSLARNIQQRLLPHELPQSDFFQIHAITMPCQTVGGDYYDVVNLPGERYGLTVADVSGKGLPAAMLAAMLQGAFVAVATGDPELEELFKRVNDFLCARTPPEMFATLFYGVLDRHGRFTFVNAGHATPLVARASGVVNRLDSSNFPLGFFPGVGFAVDSVQLEHGDNVLVFSDGVTEAQNADDELFGEARLKEFLEKSPCQTAPEACDKVIAAVQDFVGSAPQADDLTLTVLRFGPAPGKAEVRN